MTISTLKRTDLVYPELSFIIVGCAYEVFNELGQDIQKRFIKEPWLQFLKKRKSHLKNRNIIL